LGGGGAGKSHALLGDRSVAQPRGLLHRAAERLLAAAGGRALMAGAAEVAREEGPQRRPSVDISRSRRPSTAETRGGAASARRGDAEPTEWTRVSSDADIERVIAAALGEKRLAHRVFVLALEPAGAAAAAAAAPLAVPAAAGAAAPLPPLLPPASQAASSGEDSRARRSVLSFFELAAPRAAAGDEWGARVDAALGAVAKAALGARDAHSPRLDSSALQRALQPFASRDAALSVVVFVSPDESRAPETLALLQFANRARGGGVGAPRPTTPQTGAEGEERRARQLEAELAETRRQLHSARAYHERQMRSLQQAAAAASLGPASPLAATARSLMVGGGGGGGGGDSPASAAVAAALPSPAPSGDAHSPSAREVGRAAEHATRHAAALQKRLARREEALAQLQTQARAERERMQVEIVGYRNLISELQERVAEASQHAALAREEAARRAASEVQALRDSMAQLLSEQNERVSRLQRAFASRDNAAAAEAARDVQRALGEARSAWEEHSRRFSDEVRRQYEGWLAERDARVGALEAELAGARREAAAEAGLLRQELDYLYEYALRLSTVLQNMDAGVYEVHEKCGVRRFALPEAERRALALDPSRCRSLRAQIARVTELMRRQGVRAPPLPLSETLLREPANERKRRLLQPEDKGRGRGDGEGECGGGDGGGGGDVDGDARAKLVRELASDATVAHLRRLESERDHYRRELAREARRARDLQVALEAQKRLLRGAASPAASSAAASAAASRAASPAHLREQLRLHSSLGFHSPASASLSLASALSRGARAPRTHQQQQQQQLAHARSAASLGRA
jgi:hypothetical protein